MDIPPELNPQDWETIVNDSESGAPAQMNKSQVKATEKLVLSIANLGLRVRSISLRAEDLQKSIDKFNNESSKLYKIYIWLTVVIVLATVTGVLISIFKK